MLQVLSQNPHKEAQRRAGPRELWTGICVGKGKSDREDNLYFWGQVAKVGKVQKFCRWQTIFSGCHKVLGPHLELARYNSEIYMVPFWGLALSSIFT